MNSAAIATYHARLERVLRHIEAHLEETLTVEALSGVAAFSKHHFHRQFAALFGIGVHRYIQLARLKRASYRLAFRDGVSVIELALDSGYAGPEAFARAFRQRLGQMPSEFRDAPDWAQWQAAMAPLQQTRTRHMTTIPPIDTIAIVTVPETRVAILRHQGDPARIGDTIRRFIAWRKSAGLPPRVSATFNIFHDDPDAVAPEDFRLDLCAATDRPIEPSAAGIVAGVIPGGRCARLRHVGSDDGLGAALTMLYRDWLPGSGESLRDFPPYAQRISFFPDVPENETIVDLFLPLANPVSAM